MGDRPVFKSRQQPEQFDNPVFRRWMTRSAQLSSITAVMIFGLALMGAASAIWALGSKRTHVAEAAPTVTGATR